MKLNNYDHIAPYYDLLSRVVFFNAQRDAQKDQLSFITEGQKVLITGGGTGWILKYLAKSFHHLCITYVEISGNMLSIAKRQDSGSNKVIFVHTPIENFKDEEAYDIIITAFLFDNFKETRATEVFIKLHGFLKPGGQWLFSDFFINDQKPGIWQNLLLSTMYLFFRWISSVEADKLMDTSPLFLEHHYQKIQEKRYYRAFIKGIVYQKSRH